MSQKSPQESRSRTGNRPGQSARAKQQELARAAPIKTFFTRLFLMTSKLPCSMKRCSRWPSRTRWWPTSAPRPRWAR